MSPDNEACLTWLDSALGQAFEDGRPELWAYLEVVMEEVLFEMEVSLSVVTYSAEGV